MAEKEKFQAEIILLPNVRLAFPRIYKPEPRKDKFGKVRDPDKKFYSAEFLLDPSNAEHAATIKKIKQEARRALEHRFGPQDQWPEGLISPYGLGNDLPKKGRKIPNGYENMFWIRAKRNEADGPVLVVTRQAVPVREGEPGAPFGGATVNAKVTFWTYDNESKGANITLRSVQMVKEGPAFAGGTPIDPESEFDQLAGDAPTSGGGGVRESDFD